MARGDFFMVAVRRLRAAYQELRDATNLVPPGGQYVVWNDMDTVDGENCRIIRLADIPGSLSGDVLRLKRNLPPLDAEGDYIIVGNGVYYLPNPPPFPRFDNDSEDVSAALASLPVIAVDVFEHFTKKCKYASEIQNLLACQGGSCPGVPKSAHVVQLLGKSPDGELVFEQFAPRHVLAAVHPLAKYKEWILQLINGLRTLHSLEIVHRDLRIDNLVFSHDGSRLLICDLESRWGNRLAPEIPRRPVPGAGWTEKSDIYDLGMTIKGMIYGNTPITNLIEWNVPAPLDAVVAACLRVAPEDRPSLDEIYDMVKNI
ncbi:kinase-like domain-containing protein [Lasiosphaeria ovina]|uniref:EKC/KEOPS complex subunit BUD32 n=1 Tax=Lasiosphaeria ovina TaxID=92902 RepID=A0AAE0KHR3_9PEZI|nr:kinase-like domain-containing protein [Lasiosphaeria ovina]